MGCLQLNLQFFCSCSGGLPPRAVLGNGRAHVLTFLPGDSPHLTLRCRRYQHRVRSVPGNHLFILSRVIPGASGVDYSTFIPLSAGLLFLYWIANFVVPELAITRRSETEKEDSSSSPTSNVVEATDPSESSNKRQGRQRRKSSKAR
ncbi:uncharacterized protein LOC116252152 [Nymphaea colorata]|uniref:uncharacterized protein LOC116252152 n=1 Tax=Nymphaea colorata TaxID=210225 RepID=UPI00129DEDC6|nr:uncharacterized protein LOC116252152 [Nymphaea colorata]